MDPNKNQTPETGPASQPEQIKESEPQAPAAAPAHPAAPTPAAAQPAAIPAAAPHSTVAATKGDQGAKPPTPATADDVDVIEKEWVDAAEAVVEGTKEDPHTEEEGFENLQVDYLKKRYGKDIQKPE